MEVAVLDALPQRKLVLYGWGKKRGERLLRQGHRYGHGTLKPHVHITANRLS